MSETIVWEWHALWYAVAAGAVFAWLYDNLRLLRRLFSHNRWLVNAEDVLFLSGCFGASFVLLYYGNHGVLRSFAVLGAALGIFLYSVTIGRYYVKWSTFLLRKLTAPLLVLLRFMRNGLTRMLNHFTIIRKKRQYRRGESVHASRARSAKKQKKAGVSAQKE